MKYPLYWDTGGLRPALGLLVLRVFVGAAFVAHGWPKIKDPLGWMGPDPPFPSVLVLLAAIAEFVGGIALILGAATPVAALLLAATMFVAVFVIHLPAGDPFLLPKEGPRRFYELAAVYLAANVTLLLVGPGRFSVDAALAGKCCQFDDSRGSK
jgi:putative oxidoreductase